MLSGKRGSLALVSHENRTQDRRVLLPIAGLPAGIHRREQHRGAFPQSLQQVAQDRILPSGRDFTVEMLVEIE